MKQISWHISKYLVTTIAPYFALSWLLLSVILFVQQASRYSDIFFSANIPTNLIWQLSIALVPNVIAFTCPMAVMVGTIIGLSKLSGDSELIAIRASGVGNFQLAAPLVFFGILLSIFAFIVNLKGVPFAASLVRDVAIRTAIQKLESPIEPGVFNSEVAGYTIYVRRGDVERGRWQDIFVYDEGSSAGVTRLITSSEGRIDNSDTGSELVLSNGTVTTIPKDPTSGTYSNENIAEARFAVKTPRKDLIQRLANDEKSPETLGLRELAGNLESMDEKDRIAAELIWQRRIILSISPLIFCLLGTALVLRFPRAGRGHGVALSFAGLVAYYLIAFAGEQLAKAGNIPVIVAGIMPIVASAAAIAWFTFSRRVIHLESLWIRVRDLLRFGDLDRGKVQTRNFFVDLTTGLRDLDLIADLIKYFAIALSFLISIYAIFTAFELWRFSSTFEGGNGLLAKYLFFSLPFVYQELAPSAAMVAILATYTIKSRQNEVVTWTSAGLSIYRLLLPCLLLAALLGVANWQVQERFGFLANRIQDEFRDQIRRSGREANKARKYWSASGRRIYSFELPTSTVGDSSANDASDNEQQDAACSSCVRNVSVYQFDETEEKLQSLYQANVAHWQDKDLNLEGEVSKFSITDGRVVRNIENSVDLAEEFNPFIEIRIKPSHMTASEIRSRIESSESDLEKRRYGVALNKRYVTILLPFVIALFTAPFSLTLAKKGNVVAIGYAVGLWLLYMGMTSTFAQLGSNGVLSPALSVWAPVIIFATAGIYLLTRLRT